MQIERYGYRFAAAIALACATWGVFLVSWSRLISGDAPASHRPQAMQMQLVELPPAAALAPSAKPATPADSPRRDFVPKPVPARPVLAPARPAHLPRPVRAAPSRDPLPSQETQQPSAQSPSAQASADDARAASRSDPEPAAASSGAAGNAQARLISQPLPTLPDDLREQGYQLVAIARFLIHADGTFDIDLVKATPNPRLNQLLLQALRRWRFSPAMENGHAIESRQDVRVHFNVN